jgi:hypothetical protein
MRAASQYVSSRSICVGRCCIGAAAPRVCEHVCGATPRSHARRGFEGHMMVGPDVQRGARGSHGGCNKTRGPRRAPRNNINKIQNVSTPLAPTTSGSALVSPPPPGARERKRAFELAALQASAIGCSRRLTLVTHNAVALLVRSRTGWGQTRMRACGRDLSAADQPRRRAARAEDEVAQRDQARRPGWTAGPAHAHRASSPLTAPPLGLRGGCSSTPRPSSAAAARPAAGARGLVVQEHHRRAPGSAG